MDSDEFFNTTRTYFSVCSSAPSTFLWFGLIARIEKFKYPTGVWYKYRMDTTIHVDEQVQEKALRRLSIIEGQVRGLRRMVEESNGCVEILTQISAIHEALRGVGKLIVRHHIETCVTEGLRTDKKRQHQDELMDLIYKLSK